MVNASTGPLWVSSDGLPFLLCFFFLYFKTSHSAVIIPGASLTVFNFRRCPKEKMHEHPRSFLSDRDVCLLSSLLSKSQRTSNRTRPSNNARALPNRLQGTIPNRINILSKRASHAHARNSVKICQERQKNVAEWSWPKAHVFPSEPGRFDHTNSCYLFVLGLLKMSNFLMTLLQPVIRAEGLSFEQRQ
jgi:hypothetical protein